MFAPAASSLLRLLPDFPERIIFHGKQSPAELQMAQEVGAGRIVVDSFHEMGPAREGGGQEPGPHRGDPGIEAHTHEVRPDGSGGHQLGSASVDVAFGAVRRALEIPGCELVGLHAHIGSQISRWMPSTCAVERIAAIRDPTEEDSATRSVSSTWAAVQGIAHNEDEVTPDVGEAIAWRSSQVVEATGQARGPATVRGARAQSSARRPPTNIRPALYGAEYVAVLAGRMDEPGGAEVTICGKHCESGDILIKDLALPAETGPGDILCIPATGAYTYSMASNYNRIPRPAVVLVWDGEARQIVRRETYEDLLRLDESL